MSEVQKEPEPTKEAPMKVDNTLAAAAPLASEEKALEEEVTEVD